MIVNADDLGYSSDINTAVIESLIRGYCTHATIMANMPGFEEACELVRENELVNRVGIHWVLTEGQPLTDDLKRCRRFCDADGRFCLTRSVRVLHLDGRERDAIRAELAAQLDRCRAQGLDPQHADSHRHAHEEWAIASVAIEACRSGGIRWLRLARNMGRSTGLGRAAYRRLLNWRIRRAGLARTRYFGSWEDYEFAARHGLMGENNIELMVHPRYGDTGVLIDATCGRSLGRIKTGSSKSA